MNNKDVIVGLLEKSIELIKGDYEFEHPPKEPVKEPEPDRPSLGQKNSKLLWYPVALTDADTMKTRGKYPDKYPKGAIVHFTAGRSLNGAKDAKNTVNYGVKQGYAYMCIGNDGSVYQTYPLDEWGYHAGTSSWPSLGSSVSDKLVGIEVCCAGRLDSKMTSWFGEKYEDNQVRYSESVDNIQKGFYHKYTESQEKALVDLLCWLKFNNEDVFSFDLVLGHDEVAPTRKNDPGASLSMSMPKFREHLKKVYSEKYGK